LKNSERASTKRDPDQSGQLAPLGFRKELALIVRAAATSAVGKRLLLLILGIFVILAMTAYGQIRLNRWNKPFYDALSRRDIHDFLIQLAVFFVIAAILLALNVAQRWLVETLEMRLREGLVRNLLDEWLQPRRAFWLANSGSMGVNPDQRIHEDTRKLCELSADLGVGLLQAAILFSTFASVLWLLSSGFIFRFGERDYAIPGFMVWAAILYALAGSLMSYTIGRSLVERSAHRYACEADLRFSLVRVNEHVDDISLAEGESGERHRIELTLLSVLAATRRIVLGHANLTWVTSGFGWVTLVAPVLVAAPLYFNGKVTFGGMMMAAGAFTQAQSSLRWFIDNFSAIADWRATLVRVANFRHALEVTGRPAGFAEHIRYEHSEPGLIQIEDLEIVSPASVDKLAERLIQIRRGERLLIVGSPGASKTQLFHALAGLWPWGTGAISMPEGEAIFYMPRGTPYLPSGTLREILAYPLKVDAYPGDVINRSLFRLGLERLAPMLDEIRRWDRELSQDEQQSVAFARVLLQKPPWLLIEGAFQTLEPDVLELVMEILTDELRDTGIVYIGAPSEAKQLFQRTVHLVKATRQQLSVGTASAIGAQK
jgi:putative ATP-binding cassette transporter